MGGSGATLRPGRGGAARVRRGGAGDAREGARAAGRTGDDLTILLSYYLTILPSQLWSHRRHVLALPVEREMIASTVESIRMVAKEAREVVEESYDQDDLDAFTEALTPVFQRAM
eukprot:scaffold8577_cov61-Phaeocystis_antarctica.AAC.2